MNKKVSFIAMMTMSLICAIAMIVSSIIPSDDAVEKTTIHNTVTAMSEQLAPRESKSVKHKKDLNVTEPIEPLVLCTESNLYTRGLSEREVELIALVTMAEAEGESELGKRLVIDTILNRCMCDKWPDTVEEVIYQPHQFTAMWNGRVERCYVSDDICKLVREEFGNQRNYDIMYFTAGAYGKYGTPAFQVGNHYFSTI